MNSSSHSVAVGVIGAGGMGARHTENLHSKVVGARVAGVADIDRDRAESLAAACGGARTFRDASSLIHSDNVEAVLIASPDSTHAEYALECLRVNKPVFCEKPLATRVPDAKRILDAETRLGRKLVQVGFMRRFDPQHRALKRELAAGTVGRPILYKGWHRNVKTGDYGVATEIFLTNSAVHDVDSARWLLAQDVEAVFVSGVNTDARLGSDVLDLLLLQLFLSNGCLATIELYVNAAYGYEVGAEIVGESGTVSIGPAGGPVIRSERFGAVRVDGNWLERFRQAYVSELQAWIEAIQRNTHAGSDVWDGYISLLVVEACRKSLQSGSPYRLPSYEKPELYA